MSWMKAVSACASIAIAAIKTKPRELFKKIRKPVLAKILRQKKLFLLLFHVSAALRHSA
jgi:hypothetical protein